MIITACPLDCYDACEVVFDETFKASKTHQLSNGKLCANFGKLISQKRLQTEDLQKKLELIQAKLANTEPSKILYYKGSGNMGVMQEITRMVFAKMGATIATGSLCDGAGEAGIVANRKAVINPHFANLLQSDIVVVWGRNLTVTSPHIYSAIANKQFITIDPVKTEIAKQSALHIQIKPKTDYLLALVLARFVFIEDSEDKAFLESIGAKYKEFYDFTRGIRIKEALMTLGISLDDIGDFLHLISGKKVAFLIGLGVQKYFEGDDIVRCIDALGAVLGLFNTTKGGVWYLGDSKHGFINPFQVPLKQTVEKPSVDFGAFDVVFIQGANPVVTAPCTQKVIAGLQKAFVIYFGTTLNETSEYANITLAAKTFMAKKDIRLSYATDDIVAMDVVREESNAISEYELALFLDNTIEDEAFYLSHFQNPVQNKTITTFEFIDEIDVEIPLLHENEFYCITCKSKHGLNSQFAKDDFAYFAPNVGVQEDEEVVLKSKAGEMAFVAKIDPNLRADCVMLYAGNTKVNYLTTQMSSKSGKNAIYQELKIKLVKPYQEDHCDLYDSF